MKTWMNKSSRWLMMLLLFGMMSTAMAQQTKTEAQEIPSVEMLEQELAELESIDKDDLSKADRKALRKDKRKLKKQIDRMYLSEWRHIQATNPYARNNRWDAFRYGNPYFYGAPFGAFYRPYYPVRRIYIIKK